MAEKKTVPNQLTSQELQIIAQLRQHPEMMARFQSILDITGNADGPLKTADEVEELLIQEMRRVGNAAMKHTRSPSAFCPGWGPNMSLPRLTAR